MNERNVKALVAALTAADEECRRVTGCPFLTDSEAAADAARFLASRGVLVPSVLTPDEWEELDMGLSDDPEAATRLERIAKGEL